MRVLICLILLSTFCACTLEPIFIDPDSLGDYYIYARLSNTYDEQPVYIEKTIPENQSRYVPDAKVWISYDSTIIRFIYFQDGYYRENGPGKLKVIPGMKYDLHAQFSDGHSLTATTVVPDIPEILYPVQGDTVIQDFTKRKVQDSTLAPIRWKQSRNALRYKIILIPKDGFLWSLVGSYQGTSGVIPHLRLTSSAEKNNTYETDLYLFAINGIDFDLNNGHNSDEKGDDWISDLNNPNITGGIGYFISMSCQKQQLFIKRKPVQ
ncbi:DUF4249 family protein [candidate division KSB1 bacterium]|nr:DUF4249 family protein [candidate division KSB1 bacterium]